MPRHSPIEIQTNERILFIQLRAMGDALLLTPLIRTVKEAHPGIQLDVLAQPIPAQVLENNPYIDEILIAPGEKPGIDEYVQLLGDLRREQYTLAVDFISTPGSALLTWLVGARRRIGYRLKFRSWAYTHPVARRVEPLYNPLTKYDLLRSFILTSQSVKPEVYPGEEERAYADRVWERIRNFKAGAVIALAPWSKRPWRRWKIEAWLDVMHKVSASIETCWLLFGTENERPELQAIETETDLVIRWAGARHVLQAAALIQRCNAMFCVDNGLKHVAVAVDTPALTIFTGSDPQVWNPPDDVNYPYIDLRNITDDHGSAAEIANSLVHLLDYKKANQ
jgi:ADP-heptose:LPS heptosyltransferase